MIEIIKENKENKEKTSTLFTDNKFKTEKSKRSPARYFSEFA